MFLVVLCRDSLYFVDPSANHTTYLDQHTISQHVYSKSACRDFGLRGVVRSSSKIGYVPFRLTLDPLPEHANKRKPNSSLNNANFYQKV